MTLQYCHLVWQYPPWSEWEEVQRSAHCKSNLPMRLERPSSQNYTKLIKILPRAFLFTSVPSDLNKKVWFSPKVNLNSPFPAFLVSHLYTKLIKFYHFQMQIRKMNLNSSLPPFLVSHPATDVSLNIDQETRLGRHHFQNPWKSFCKEIE